MKKVYSLILISFFFISQSFAQDDLKIVSCKSKTEVFQLLDSTLLKDLRNRHIVKNLEFHGDPRSIGYYSNGDALGMTNSTGIVMATGLVDHIEGANSDCDSDTGPFNIGIKDNADMNQLAGTNTFDASIIEFDITICHAICSRGFRLYYVFGSEEYGTSSHGTEINDCFGTFISDEEGEITGEFSNESENLATIPLTKTYMGTNNIHCGEYDNCKEKPAAKKLGGDTIGKHARFLIWNDHFSEGSLSQLNMLTSPIIINKTLACGTYHIKIAIADAKDDKVISAVFIENNQFNIPFYELKVEFSNPKTEIISKDINHADLHFEYEGEFTEKGKMELEYSGTAVRGVDYLHDNLNNQANDLVDFIVESNNTKNTQIISTGNCTEKPKSVVIAYKPLNVDYYLYADTLWIHDQKPSIQDEVNSEYDLFIPTIFSPNQDGKDDYFAIKYKGDIQRYQCVIYDLQGKKVFITEDINEQWDGKVNGKLVPQGCYVVKVEIKSDNKNPKRYSKTIILSK
ncbi:MAG: choice-of-anchor L domain-containing protein [Bacteroidales bacterium]